MTKMDIFKKDNIYNTEYFWVGTWPLFEICVYACNKTMAKKENSE